MKLFLFSILILLNLISSFTCSKIIAIFPYPSKSHAILGQALSRELAVRGHDVTFLSMYPLKSEMKNHHDVVITSKEVQDTFQQCLDFAFDGINGMNQLIPWFKVSARMQEYIITDPAVQKLIKSDVKYDLCIIEILFNESLLGLTQKFGCKVVIMSTIGQVKYINPMLHSPMPASHIPHPYSTLSDKMNFIDRVKNVAWTWTEDLLMHFFHYPLQEAIYEKYFGENSQKFHDVVRNSASLALLNTHVSLNFPQAYLPNMIEIGGFHVKNTTNPLSPELKSFIENAKHGVIYFSLGGNLKPSKMSVEKKNAIIDALKATKQRIIWKWDDESLQEDSDKFLIRKWLPQDDILAHPNVKLFITHGGLLSCTEAIIRGTPVVGIPIFADQMMNMARAQRLGWGASVAFTNLTTDSLTWAINEVLSNPKYELNVQKIAARLRDQPQTAMERAIFWIEFVLRHDGADFMKTSARHLNLFEYYNFDVYFTYFSVIVSSILIFYTLLKWLIRSVQFKSDRKLKEN